MREREISVFSAQGFFADNSLFVGFLCGIINYYKQV